MQTATISDIDGNVSRSAFLQLYEEYDVADQAVAEAIGARKDLRKRIKGAGFHLGAFDHTRKEARKDSELRTAENREFQRNMAWIGKPIGYQADWVGTTSPAPEAEGNGVDGESISEHQGWMAGQESIAESMAPPEKRRRGRPPGTRNRPKLVAGDAVC